MIAPEYKPDMDIRNLSALPGGLGCRYLVCEYAEAGGRNPHRVYNAVSWHRVFGAAEKKAVKMGGQSAVVVFPK